MTNLVALIYQLMSTSNRLQTIDVVKFGGNLISEQPTGASRTDSPCVDILRITPDKVTESSLMRDLLGPGNDADLVDCSNLGTETTVHTEDGTVDDGGQDQKVEHLTTGLPDRRVAILCLAFLVKSINLRDLP